jgi:RNA polymerase sigma-70 factor, ECF subfamily
MAMNAQEQEAVFRRWLEDHLGLMLKVVRAWAALPEDREDLLQEVLLQVWCSIPAYRGEAKETTWIYRVAFNTALAWRRAEQRRRQKHERWFKFDAFPQAQTSHTDKPANTEVVEQLYVAIRQLPKVDASLALMHLDGLSYREMAEVLGISESNVGVKLNRMKKELAQLLKGVTDEL